MDPGDPESRQDESAIPVFEPTMEQFADFYRFCEAIDSWGMRTGIVKVIPPKEWIEKLPSIRAPDVSRQEQETGASPGSLPTLESVRIKSAIAQHFSPAFKPGLWRQTNITRPAKVWDAKQWSDVCQSLSGPTMARIKELVEIRRGLEQGVDPDAIKDAPNGIRTRSGRGRPCAASNDVQIASSTSPQKKRKRSDTKTPRASASAFAPVSPSAQSAEQSNDNCAPVVDRPASDSASPHAELSRETSEGVSTQAPAAAASKPKTGYLTSPEEWASFDPDTAWLKEWKREDAETSPRPEDWTMVACREIEGEYWRGLNFGKPPMYGADLKGTLFTPATKAWNVNSLDNLLTRLKLRRKIAGVTDPYLYFGMWRATFAWHVEDMDLYSINYIHFGAPKQWYAIPQRDRLRFETALASAFPADARRCSQFMRHKSFLASPTFLAANNIRPLKLVQHAREFVITYPFGYHSGFNLGFNCAESVNFALDSWLDIGRKAKACECEDAQQSVKMDVDALLEESEELKRAERRKEERERVKLERAQNDELRKAAAKARRAEHKRSQKQAAALDGSVSSAAKPRKRSRKSDIADTLPCVFCPSLSAEDVVNIPPEQPTSENEKADSVSPPRSLQAHRFCANSIPECWVQCEADTGRDEVRGYYTIAKARWNLKCSICSPASARYGCAVQCTFGNCAKAAHPTCAAHEASGWMMDMLTSVEADRLEARGAFGTKSKKAKKNAGVSLIESANDADATSGAAVTNPLPLGHELDESRSAYEVAVKSEQEVSAVFGAPSSSERMVVLCRGHNPAAKQAKQMRKTRHLRECALRLRPGSRIKVKTNGGIWETTLIALKDAPNAMSEGEALVDDAKGPRRVIKWSRIVFPPDIVAPVSQASDHEGEAGNASEHLSTASADITPISTLSFHGANLLSEAKFSLAKRQCTEQPLLGTVPGRLPGGVQPHCYSPVVMTARQSGKGRGSNEIGNREREDHQTRPAATATPVIASARGSAARPADAIVDNDAWSVAPLGAHTSSSRVLIGSSFNSTLITPANINPLHPYAMTKGPGYGYGTNSFGHHSLVPVRQKVFPAIKTPKFRHLRRRNSDSRLDHAIIPRTDSPKANPPSQHALASRCPPLGQRGPYSPPEQSLQPTYSSQSGDLHHDIYSRPPMFTRFLALDRSPIRHHHEQPLPPALPQDGDWILRGPTGIPRDRKVEPPEAASFLSPRRSHEEAYGETQDGLAALASLTRGDAVSPSRVIHNHHAAAPNFSREPPPTVYSVSSVPPLPPVPPVTQFHSFVGREEPSVRLQVMAPLPTIRTCDEEHGPRTSLSGSCSREQPAMDHHPPRLVRALPPTSSHFPARHSMSGPATGLDIRSDPYYAPSFAQNFERERRLSERDLVQRERDWELGKREHWDWQLHNRHRECERDAEHHNREHECEGMLWERHQCLHHPYDSRPPHIQ